MVDFIQAVLDINIQQNQEHPATVDFSETSDSKIKQRLAQNTELRSRL
jgi:hypothetical protein